MKLKNFDPSHSRPFSKFKTLQRKMLIKLDANIFTTFEIHFVRWLYVWSCAHTIQQGRHTLVALALEIPHPSKPGTSRCKKMHVYT